METNATSVPTSGVEKLAAALAKAQAKFKNPEKNRTVKVQHKAGGSHTYSYATLDTVLDATRGPLSENGIVFTQLVTTRDGQSVLVSKLIHESGQELESVYPLPTGLGMQEFGAAITYARRYCACPMLGIAGETDTDGEEAQAAQELVDETKKAEAADRLKKIAAEGRLKSAYTGAPIKPEDIKTEAPKATPPATTTPTPTAAPAATPPTEDKIPMGFPTDPDPAIDKRLEAKLRESRITLREFKDYAVKKGHFPAAMDMSKLEAKYLNTIISNWETVKTNIKGGK